MGGPTARGRHNPSGGDQLAQAIIACGSAGRDEVGQWSPTAGDPDGLAPAHGCQRL